MSDKTIYELMKENQDNAYRLGQLSVLDARGVEVLCSNPPISRKNELLGKWHNQTLTYEESLELKVILEQQAKQADEATKALIIIALIGLGLYLLVIHSNTPKCQHQFYP